MPSVEGGRRGGASMLASVVLGPTEDPGTDPGYQIRVRVEEPRVVPRHARPTLRPRDLLHQDRLVRGRGQDPLLRVTGGGRDVDQAQERVTCAQVHAR